MDQVSLRQVAAWTGGRCSGPDRPLNGLCIDSRKATPGDLFVALRGERCDGHAFAGEAFASGCAAALVDRAEIARTHRDLGRPVVLVEDCRLALRRLAAAYRRSLDLQVIAVTGSNGKTTTKEMLRLLLGSRACVSPRSFNNDLGVPLTLLAAKRSHEFCVVEMGTNAPGEIAALAVLARPDLGIVLNVAESHLLGLGTLSGVAAEKRALVQSLPRDGCAVLNWDDPHTRGMMHKAPCQVLSFGTWPDADVFAADIRTRGYTLAFRLLGRKRVRMRLIGVHNVHNALAAAAAALWLGEDPYTVCLRLEKFRPAPMRMAVEAIGRVRLINDAYNANPRSVSAALHEISDRSAGRRIAVLGDMHELGPRAGELHAALGRQVARSRVDILWAVGPLSERTAAAARAAGLRRVYWSPSVQEAAARPPVRVRSRDIVLFKASRAMRLERLVATIREAVAGRRRRQGTRTAVDS